MSGPLDFTNEDIENTYQRVLQTDGVNVYDGTGSLFVLPSTNTSSLLITASATSNIITFTKGDGSTFPITVDTGSASFIDTGSFVTTSSFNSFTSSYNTGSFTGSFIGIAETASFTPNSIVTGSVLNNILTFTKGDGSSFNLTVDTGSGGGSPTNTGSLLVTASATLNQVTFTKGDASQFTITIDTGSSPPIDTGSFVTTSSFNSFTSSYNTGSFTGSFTGELIGTASWATNTLTASFVTASNVYGPFGSNSILSASYASQSLSSSYSLSSSFTQTSSFYQETDPVFIAKSASLATTGSNIFIGNQTISGSVFITGSTEGGGSGHILTYNTSSGEIFFTASSAIGGINPPLTTGSIIGDGTLGNEIKLVNDQVSPGNSKYYGTDGSGTKGFFNLPNTSIPPIDGNYIDQTAMIADQGNQLVQYIYFDGTDYWEYLGTTNGDITDYRKISDSNTDSYQGQMGRISSGVVNIATSGTYQATGLIGTLDTVISDGIALSTTDQLGLRNVSGKTVDFKIFASADIEAGNNKVLGIILAKNGTIIPETECRAPTGVGTSFAKLFTNWIISMADGDQVTIYVTNHSTSGNITIDRCRMLAITSGGVGSGGSGTVTSVGLSLPSIFSVSGSPVTTSGDLTGSLVNQSANTFFAGPVSGSPAAPSFRALTTQDLSLPFNATLNETFDANAAINSIEFVPSVNKIYVASGNNNVTIIDGTTYQQLAVVSVTAALKVKYIASINEVWCTSATVASITRIDPSTNASLGTITTGITANGRDILEYSASKVFITCTFGSVLGGLRIMVIDPSTLSLTTDVTTNVPPFAASMVLNNNASSLQFDKIIVGGSGGVGIFDPNTNAITTSVANPSSAINNAWSIDYSPTLDQYFISSISNHTVVCLDIASSTTFTLNKIKYQAWQTASLAVDDANNRLIFSQIPSNATNLNFLIHFINLTTFESLINVLTPSVGGGNSTSGPIKLDTINKRVIGGGRGSSRSVSVVKYT
jgi:hypothetical protein